MGVTFEPEDPKPSVAPSKPNTYGGNKVNTEEPACSHCKGTGEVNGTSCISCGGNGDGDIW